MLSNEIESAPEIMLELPGRLSFLVEEERGGLSMGEARGGGRRERELFCFCVELFEAEPNSTSKVLC